MSPLPPAAALLLLAAACRYGPSLQEEMLATARKELGRARAHQAFRYAPEPLRAAEEALWAAELESRRYSARLNPYADPSANRRALQRAVATARRAAEQGESALARAREQAETLLWAARSGIEAARRTAGRMALPIPVRTTLARAELLALEAAALTDREELLLAAERARRAHALAGGAQGEAERLAARFLDPAERAAWREWAGQAQAASRGGAPALVVDKRAHRATLYERGLAVRSFDVDLGFNSLHPKREAGDGATPEGRYRVAEKKGAGRSIYYKALLLDYPNADDLRRFRLARESGRTEAGSAGGLIELHGEGGRGRDWTEGCVALANEDVEVLFRRLQVGSAVVIVGSLEQPEPARR